MKACINNQVIFTFFLVMGFLLLNISAIAASPTTDIRTVEPSPVGGYYVIHWPGKNAEVFFHDQFMGRIDGNSLIVPVATGMQKYSRYSVISGNRTLFTDTLPEAPVSGEYIEVFPRWIQTNQPRPDANASVRTYQVYWPDDGVLVEINGVYQGTIFNGLCRIEIPGQNIPGHPEYPKTISLRYPDKNVVQTFSINIIPEVGGVTDYYLFWSSPHMYPDEPPRKREQRSVPGPLWINQFDASNLDISVSKTGEYGAIGTTDTGIARMFSSQGNVLWSYHDYGKTLLVAVSENGDFCAIASRKDAWTVEESQGEILLAGRNGTIFWKKTLNQGASSVAISPDGSSVFVTAGQMMEILSENGERWEKISIPHTWSPPAVANGRWIVSSGTNSLYYYSSNGSLVWSYPVSGRITGISLSLDGSRGAATSDDHLYFFTRDGEVIWQKPWKYRFTEIDISGDGEYVTASSQYRLLYYNNLGELLWQKEHSGYVQDVSISANGSNVAAVFVPGNLRLYNHEGKKFWDYQLSKTPPARSNVVLSDNGRFVAVNEGGYLNYFNEWGNATVIIDEVILNTTISTKELSDVSSHSTPASSPLSVFFVIAALLLCAIIIFCWKKI
ncbi:MAG: hypothetical protein CVV32_07500 [Methanomicrobiales archaeon HGW-Methanomicrobiales-3]|jgi:hypothetical protein|nr:MAG: hypothetical protein CVV32_07500 [Methanomicrobiales archaeon HGW-Methanomicrobiales-3]